MKKIYLARHGQNEDNAEKLLNGRRDRPLTDLGRSQAGEVATKLVGNGIKTIISSPLARSLETASIIADQLGIKSPISNNLFIERDFGILTGKPVTDIPKYATKTLPTEGVLYFLEVEGTEDFPTLFKRGSEALRFIQSNYPNEVVLAVCHGDIGKMIKAAYYGMHWKDVLQDGYFSHTTIYELK